MNVNYVEVGDGKKLPFKFTKRAINAFEAETKINLQALPVMTTNESNDFGAQLCKHALIAGARILNEKVEFTLDEIYELDEKYDIIDQMLTAKEEEEKK